MAREMVGCEVSNVSAKSACARLRRREVNVTITAFRRPNEEGTFTGCPLFFSSMIKMMSRSICALVKPVVEYTCSDPF